MRVIKIFAGSIDEDKKSISSLKTILSVWFLQVSLLLLITPRSSKAETIEFVGHPVDILKDVEYGE